MSYKQAMNWQKNHPKGTKQPILMHTNSGFWPSHAYLQKYWAYCADCEAQHTEPMGCEAYYYASMRQ